MKLNRALKRLLRKRDHEIIIRSESVTEVLENILGRKLVHDNAADMGLLDEFKALNDRLKLAPEKTREQVQKLWYEQIKQIKAVSSDQQTGRPEKEEVCQE